MLVLNNLELLNDKFQHYSILNLYSYDSLKSIDTNNEKFWHITQYIQQQVRQKVSLRWLFSIKFVISLIKIKTYNHKSLKNYHKLLT